jgi:endoglucanase
VLIPRGVLPIGRHAHRPLVPPHLSRSSRCVALVAALAAGLALGAHATAVPAPSRGGQVLMGRLAETAAPMRSATAVLRGSLAAIGRLAEAQGPSPFAGRPLYREPWGPAHEQARLWRRDRPADASLMDRIALQPMALWLGDWTRDVAEAASHRVEAARAAGALPVIVTYNIPNRDCGLHSSGGADDPGAYRAWVADLADGIGAGPAAVVLEPDALAAMHCLPPAARGDRTALLAWAAARLSRRPGVAVYIDAGNASWVAPAETARRLRDAGIARARGFAVNVSSFHTTARSRGYGKAVSRRVGGAPFVIDTSRNGAGPAPGDAWCNPPGRALGEAPTGQTGDHAVDALLWVKRPGESDGSCNGAPPAGTWWPEGALALARAAGG